LNDGSASVGAMNVDGRSLPRAITAHQAIK
jgi:hypothetical protein